MNNSTGPGSTPSSTISMLRCAQYFQPGIGSTSDRTHYSLKRRCAESPRSVSRDRKLNLYPGQSSETNTQNVQSNTPITVACGTAVDADGGQLPGVALAPDALGRATGSLQKMTPRAS